MTADDSDGCSASPATVIAEALYRGLSSHAPAGAPVYLDVPEVDPGAMALPERYGMRRVFETARLYRGSAPDVEIGPRVRRHDFRTGVG